MGDSLRGTDVAWAAFIAAATAAMLNESVAESALEARRIAAMRTYLSPSASQRVRWLAPEVRALSVETDAGVRRAERELGGVEHALDFVQWRAPTCHRHLHAPGGRVYARFNADLERALRACGWRCRGGCFHGVAGAHVRAIVGGGERGGPSAPSSAPSNATFDALAAFVTDPRVPAIALASAGEAMHSVGHGLRQARPALRAALRACAGPLAARVPAPGSMLHYCAGGVHMEHLHRHRHALGESYVARAEQCARAHIPPLARPSCFYYAVRAVPTACGRCESVWRCVRAPLGQTRCRGDVREQASHLALRALCAHSTAGSAAEVGAACWFGAGAAATYLTTGARHGEGQACAHAPGTRARLACIDGLVFRAHKYFGAPKLRELCAEQRGAAERALCEAVGGAGMYTLAKERTLMRLYEPGAAGVPAEGRRGRGLRAGR